MQHLNKQERNARWPTGHTRTALDMLEAAGADGVTDAEVREAHGDSVARAFRKLRGKERRAANERPVTVMSAVPGRDGPVYTLPEFVEMSMPRW